MSELIIDDEVAIGDTCRICLHKNMLDSVSLLDSKWSQKFEYCLEIKIDEEVFGSKIMCRACCNLLLKFADFKKQCINSAIYWNNFVVKDSVVDDGINKILKTESEVHGTFDVYLDIKDEPSLIDQDVEANENNTIVKIEHNIIYNEITNDNDINFETSLITADSSIEGRTKQNSKKNKSKCIPVLNNVKRKKVRKFRGQCHNCDEIFFAQKKLEKHLKACQLENTSTVINFKTVKKYVPLMKLPKSDIFYCGLCEMSSRDKTVINRHLKEHESNSDVSCKLCNYCGVDFAETLSHRYSHQPAEYKKIIYCHECNKVYRMVKKLEFHYRGEHLGKKPGLCNVCGNTFTDYKHWKKHVGAHAGTKHRCEYCGRYFMYKSDLVSHVAYHTQGEKSFICHLCGFSCRLASGLRSHVARQHGDNTPAKCEHCGKTFKNEITLREHKMKFEGEKNFVCHVCSKKFKTEKYLESHMFWHSGLKPYVCSTCGNAYKSKCSLKSHTRSHTGERPFKCDVCMSCFWSSSILNRHKRLHTGEKAYKCTQCEKGYNIKKMLLKHLQYHEKSTDQ